MEAEAAELDGALKVMESALSHIKWRLRSHAKRRLGIGPSPHSTLILSHQFDLIAKIWILQIRC